MRRRAFVGMELALCHGVLTVTEVDAEGPAARAGLQVEDRLLAVDGVSASDLVKVRRLMARLPVGRPSQLGLLRGELPLTLPVVAEQMPLETFPGATLELKHVVWQGYRLRSLWTFPEGRGPHPVVWLLPGASWLSEEHPTTPWYPTRKLVALLGEQGFATLRIERSGLGDSEGPPCAELDLRQELAAFSLGFAHVERETRVRRDRLFLFGRSLGGMLAPLLSRGQQLAGLSVWGTSSQRWHDALLDSTLRQFALSGLAPNKLSALREGLSDLQTLVYCKALTPAQAYQVRPDLRDLLPSVYAGTQVYGRTARYFQQLQAEDVGSAFRALEAPLLALHGGCDWLSRLEDLQTIAALHPRGEWAELPGLDHLMHERASLEEAFAEPFGGSFSPAAGLQMARFFARAG